jgi:ribosome modulation factor
MSGFLPVQEFQKIFGKTEKYGCIYSLAVYHGSPQEGVIHLENQRMAVYQKKFHNLHKYETFYRDLQQSFLFRRQDTKQGASERPHEKGVAGLDGRAHEKGATAGLDGRAHEKGVAGLDGRAHEKGATVGFQTGLAGGAPGRVPERVSDKAPNRACRRGSRNNFRKSFRKSSWKGSKQGVKWKVLIMRQIIKQGQPNCRVFFHDFADSQ